MFSAVRPSLPALLRFARTPSIGRSIVALLAGAILLLLAANVTTFVMIQRTAALNEQVERSQQVRRAAGLLLLSLVDAETGQRGFLLSGDPDFLAPYNRAATTVPDQMDELERLTVGDPQLEAHVAVMLEAARDKLAELERSVVLSRTGRTGEAVQSVRSGEGRALMDTIRTQIGAVDEIEAVRLEARTRQSEHGSRLTLGANALGGLLVLVLAGVMVWLVRRYIEEIQAARDSLDRMNAGLESQVRDRTAELTLARDRAEAMLREVNHRVGNSLQLVSSFMSLQQRHLGDEGARAALKEAQARIEAVAHVHRRLYTSDDMSSVAMDEYLEGLIAELGKSLGPDHSAPTLTLKATALCVSTDQAVSIGVIVTELVTNAVKYAYGPGQTGEIRIILEPDEDNARALLTVEDDGPGLGDAKPKGTGLGGRIVSAMASGLRSKVEYDPAHAGVRARLAFDL
ncbi:CHASE3 domain-containing protein [Roseibacterium beibuensis]|uniref:sensor histidine kinase n=1 Tax=[Roseibacterium] beibuensis TaxID=1193142 RepID=UPI00217EDC18|nr:CHASE3 domain-containing protein [Roseibacterium beibuensis]MCS6627286.1 CHASE3 domain-containing protein [Roseibacterium beibuensis]